MSSIVTSLPINFTHLVIPQNPCHLRNCIAFTTAGQLDIKDYVSFVLGPGGVQVISFFKHDRDSHYDALSTQKVLNTQLLQGNRGVAGQKPRVIADLCNRFGLLRALRNSCNIS